MKKLITTVITLLISLTVLISVALVITGVPLNYILSAPGVATGMGAKLACSSKYVSGLSDEQTLQDIVDYSSVLAFLDLEYDTKAKVATAGLFGFSATASFKPGLGCAIDYDGYNARDGVMAPVLETRNESWPLGSSVSTIDDKAQDILDNLLSKDNAMGLNTRALVLVKNGQIIAESYGADISPQSQLLGWSMGKSMTSVFIGHLIQLGKISLEQRDLFEAWSADSRSQITLQNLLHMTDGLDFSEVYDPGFDATAMLFTEPSTLDFAIRQPLTHSPGDYFNYSSGTAVILAKLVQQHTGGNLEDSLHYIAENIYKPMGISNALFEADADGTLVGSSYFYASARDWARFGLLMLNEGKINGIQIMEPEYVRKAISPNTSDNEKAYGYQFWLNRGDSELRWNDLPDESYAAMGNRQQRVMIIPSEDLVIVRLGWTKGAYPTNNHFAELLSQLNQAKGL